MMLRGVTYELVNPHTDEAIAVVKPEPEGTVEWIYLGPPLPGPDARLPGSWSRKRRRAWRIRRENYYQRWWESYYRCEIDIPATEIPKSDT